MLEHVPAGIALFDAHELRLLAANTHYQDLLEPHWQHGHALGHRLIEFLPRAAYTEIAALFRKVLETGVSSRLEGYATPACLNGTGYWDYSLEPIAEQGQVRYVLLTVTEIIMQQSAITRIAEECEHLILLVHELLDVSRLEHARLELKKQYLDLLAPLSQVVTTQAQTTSMHRLHLTLEELEPGAFLMGWFDLLRIEQVIRNLLSNAMKYSPAGSEIEVGVRPRRDAQGREQEVVIWVKDQGMGINPLDMPHIFECFYRAATFDRTSISGFGIGLYLTRQLVQAHGGRI